MEQIKKIYIGTYTQVNAQIHFIKIIVFKLMFIFEFNYTIYYYRTYMFNI